MKMASKEFHIDQFRKGNRRVLISQMFVGESEHLPHVSPTYDSGKCAKCAIRVWFGGDAFQQLKRLTEQKRVDDVIVCTVLCVDCINQSHELMGKMEVRGKDGGSLVQYAADDLLSTKMWHTLVAIRNMLENKPSRIPPVSLEKAMSGPELADITHVCRLFDSPRNDPARNVTFLELALQLGHAEFLRSVLARYDAQKHAVPTRFAHIGSESDGHGDGNGTVAQTALMMLCLHAPHSKHKQFKECVELLVERKVDINEPDANGYTVLLQAAGQLGATEVECLIAARANVDHKDVRGTTALHSAVFNWKMPNVRALVAAGARIRKNAVGLTPLHVSFKADKDEESAAMLRVLLKCRNAKKKLDIVFREGNKTPLAVAVGANLIESARTLLEAGANVNFDAVPAHGHTPIWLSISHPPAMAKLLIKHGACHHPCIMAPQPPNMPGVCYSYLHVQAFTSQRCIGNMARISEWSFLDTDVARRLVTRCKSCGLDANSAKLGQLPVRSTDQKCSFSGCIQQSKSKQDGEHFPVVLKACSYCHAAHYCGKFCQTADWKRHKLQCGHKSKSKPDSVPRSPADVAKSAEMFPLGTPKFAANMLMLPGNLSPEQFERMSAYMRDYTMSLAASGDLYGKPAALTRPDIGFVTMARPDGKPFVLDDKKQPVKTDGQESASATAKAATSASASASASAALDGHGSSPDAETKPKPPALQAVTFFAETLRST